MTINMYDRNLRRVRLNVTLDKIQAIRLIGAVLESDFDFDFPPEARIVLEHLSKHFNIKYSIASTNLPVIEDIFIKHEEQPMCRIGSLERPLVYPEEMLSKCKAKWNDQRVIKFSFTGLVTPKRKKCLDEWISSHFPEENIDTNKIRTSQSGNRGKLSKIFQFLRNRNSNRITFENIGLHLFISSQGRQFPIKVWDEEYYDTLAASQFTLCPDGDFTWTYRFWEAMICGTIPIVENTCSLYEDFEYFSMQDPIENLVYSREMAERNFQRVEERFTFKLPELNSQIDDLIRSSVQYC